MGDIANGPVRMVQFIGFNDSCSALLLELCEGGRPDPLPAVMESVKAFLAYIESELHVSVGDVKFDNMLKDGQGRITVIDLGKCQYTGGAKCLRCSRWIEEEIDVHAQEHVADYIQERKRGGAVSRLRLQEYVYGKTFC